MPARKPLLNLPADLPDPAAGAAFLKGEPMPAAAPAAAPAATAPPAAPAPEPEARVRFTVDLPRSLHRSLKQAALNRDQPMTDLARQALAEWLEGQA